MREDPLGDRMKGYEQVTRAFLPRRTYTICRLDGKAFHSYTKRLDRPYDLGFMEDMAHTTVHLCKEISGTAFAYTQSDEISLLLTDFASNQTEPWFGGNIQKIVSVAASICTHHFGQRRRLRAESEWKNIAPWALAAYFDARVFTIPDPTEVANYFIWRQQDATRNSISMAASSYFSPKQLEGKTSNERQEMLWEYYDVNWNDYPNTFKRGQLIAKESTTAPVTFTKAGKEITVPDVQRSVWTGVETPIFTQQPWLFEHIPVYS